MATANAGVGLNAWEYYSSLSGLTPATLFTLADHREAYFAAQGGELAYYKAQNVGAPSYYSLADHEYLWFSTQVGILDGSLTIDDLKARYFANPAAPEPEDPVTGTFQSATSNNSDLSTYTFTARPIGTAAATRRVVVGIGLSTTSGDVSSVTIGGIAATIDADSGLATVTRRYVIVSAVVPTGTTADIVVNLTSSAFRCGIGVWSLDSGAPTGDVDAAVDQPTGTLEVTTAAGRFVVAGGMVGHTAGSMATTWSGTGVTERYDATIEDLLNAHTGADVQATGALTSLTYNSNGESTRTAFACAVYANLA